MARFDVYSLKAGNSLVVDVQANILEDLNTRIVVPLIPESPALPARLLRLNPVIALPGGQYRFMAHLLVAIPASRLGERRANLGQDHDTIVAAIDFALQGF